MDRQQHGTAAAAANAATPRSSSRISIVVSQAAILSGGLDDCRDARDGTCSGGVAAVAAYSRYYADAGDFGSLVIPQLDFRSPFVQMHPLGWAVNRLVFKYRFGWDVYLVVPSLLTAGEKESGGYWDLKDLQSNDIQPLLTNVAVPPTNSWNPFLKNVYFHEDTGLAVLSMALDNQPFATPQIESAEALLGYIGTMNRRAGCAPSESSAFGTYAALHNITTAQQNCWIPVVIYMRDAEEMFKAFVEATTNFQAPPAAIIDMRGNDPSLSQPRRVKDTWIVSIQGYGRTFSQQRLYLSDDRASVIGMASIEDDMSVIAPYVKDSMFDDDIQYIRKLADEAAVNDPVVGTSQEMPVTVAAVAPFNYRCFAGECPLGNLFTDAARWKVGADIAIVNSGGIRGPGWPAGEVRTSNIWEALPFASDLCVATISGLSLFKLFNYSTSAATFEPHLFGDGDRLLQVSGARITYNAELEGSRLIRMEVLDDELGVYADVERLKLYKVATTMWECEGFHPYPELLGTGLAVEGEIPGAAVNAMTQNTVAEYLTQLGTHYQTGLQGRLVDNKGASEPMNWIQTGETCQGGSYWVEKYQTCFDCPQISKVYFLEAKIYGKGVSGKDEDIQLKATIINEQNFTVSILPKTMPPWIQNSKEDDLSNITLEPSDSYMFQFSANVLNISAGTAQAAVSFAVQDGGSYPGCTGDDTSFQVSIRVAPQPELNKIERTRIVGYVFIALASLVVAGLVGWVHLHRQKRTVKARQPEFLIILCAGALIWSYAIFPLSILGELSSPTARNRACMAFPWLMSTGFCMMMSALFAKLWRINKIFKSPPLQRIVVPKSEALIFFFALTGCNLAILLVWALVDPLRWKILSVPGEEWKLYGSCTGMGAAGQTLFALDFALNGIILLLAAVQAFKARKLSDEFSESKDLGFAVFSAFQILLVGVPILFLTRNDNPVVRYMLFVMLIFGIGMSILLLIFLPIIKMHSSKQQRPSVHVSGLMMGPPSAPAFGLTTSNSNSELFTSPRLGAVSGSMSDPLGPPSSDLNNENNNNSDVVTLPRLGEVQEERHSEDPHDS